MLAFSHLDRQASRERSSRQGRQVRQVRQANQARQGIGRLERPGRSVKSGKSGRLGRQGTKQAKETEHSWHELRGAERSEAPRSGSRCGLLHLREGKWGKRWQRQTTECKLALKMRDAVSRTNSSRALPVLAITGVRCCKTS